MADKGPEFTYVIGHAAHEFAVHAGVRRPRFRIAGRWVMSDGLVRESGGVHVDWPRKRSSPIITPVLIEEFAARDDALVSHRGAGWGFGEDSASGVFCLAHVERERGD